MNIWPALERRDLYKVRSIDMYEPDLFTFMCYLSGNGSPGLKYYIFKRDGAITRSEVVKYGLGAREMVL